MGIPDERAGVLRAAVAGRGAPPRLRRRAGGQGDVRRPRPARRGHALRHPRPPGRGGATRRRRARSSSTVGCVATTGSRATAWRPSRPRPPADGPRLARAARARRAPDVASRPRVGLMRGLDRSAAFWLRAFPRRWRAERADEVVEVADRPRPVGATRARPAHRRGAGARRLGHCDGGSVRRSVPSCATALLGRRPARRRTTGGSATISRARCTRGDPPCVLTVVLGPLFLAVVLVLDWSRWSRARWRWRSATSSTVRGPTHAVARARSRRCSGRPRRSARWARTGRSTDDRATRAVRRLLAARLPARRGGRSVPTRSPPSWSTSHPTVPAAWTPAPRSACCAAASRRGGARPRPCTSTWRTGCSTCACRRSTASGCARTSPDRGACAAT